MAVSADLDTEGRVCVVVSDQGCGIAAEDIPKILEPFGQVRRSAHQAHAGTGLGLSLSKMLTELHGGTLRIDSILDEGTTVTLRFPLERTRRCEGCAAIAGPCKTELRADTVSSTS